MFAQDLGKAKEYLAKCKYKTPDERKIDITWITEVPAEEKMALLMKADFDPLGFQTTIKGAPWTLYTQQVTKPDSTPSISEVYIDAPTPDPDSILYNMYSSKSPPTWESASHLSDPEVDELLDAGRQENDIAKRKATYEKLEARLDAVAPAIFASEVSGVFVGLNTFHLPPFEDDFEAIFGRGVRTSIPHGRNGQVGSAHPFGALVGLPQPRTMPMMANADVAACAYADPPPARLTRGAGRAFPCSCSRSLA